MGVVKEICDRVAVMEDGHIVEEGSIVEVFTHPQAKVTKNFIASTSTTDRIYDLIEEGHALTELGRMKSSSLSNTMQTMHHSL